MPRKKENTIRKTTGKGGNYRKTKAGAGMTKKGVAKLLPDVINGHFVWVDEIFLVKTIITQII